MYSRARLCLAQFCLLSDGLVVTCCAEMLSALPRVRYGFLWGLHVLQPKSLTQPAPGSFFCSVLLHEASSTSPSTNSMQLAKANLGSPSWGAGRVSEAGTWPVCGVVIYNTLISPFDVKRENILRNSTNSWRK